MIDVCDWCVMRVALQYSVTRNLLAQSKVCMSIVMMIVVQEVAAGGYSRDAAKLCLGSLPNGLEVQPSASLSPRIWGSALPDIKLVTGTCSFSTDAYDAACT